MPAIIYRNKTGERVPSVTTVISQWGIKSKPLMYWAWKQGEKGIPLYEKEAADVGTLAHLMIDADVKGKEINFAEFPMNIVEQAKVCYQNFQEWKKRHDFKPIETEISLVSEEHQFGGTIDCVAMINGKLSIMDLKTGKEVYEDHILQVQSYQKLFEENFPDHKIDGFHLVRTGKEITMFAHHYYKDFPDAWRAFLLLRQLYDIHKTIKRLK
uniref:Putative PD-(D/E)XK nuclease superfamily protein n=1 Tax=viral metagenome TaxID=1070528 RepID=A0A6H1ZYJ3_9ZZZZ